MSGINELPQNLQAKLKPYMGIARDVNAAIEMARTAGTWTSADDKAMNAINGGANWGKIGDSLEAQAFDPSKAEVYKKEHELAQAKKPKKPTVQIGPTQEELDKKRADLRRSIAENKEKGGISGYFNAFVDAYKLKNTPEVAGQQQANAGGFLKAAVVAAGAIALVTSVSSCNKQEIRQETTVPITIKFDNLVELFAEMNQTLKDIKNGIDGANEKLDELVNQVYTLISNQVQYADSAQQYFQQIIDSIGGNTQLLNIVVDELAENNSTLNEIKTLMQENNADNKEILEVLSSVKFGVDKLHQDNGDIKTLINEVKTAINNLPSNLEAKFKGYLTSIIKGIGDGNNKLDDLIALVKLVNQNVVEGNKQQQQAAAKLLAAVQAMNCNMTAGMNAILKAINEGNSKVIASIDKLTKIAQDFYNKFKDHDEKTNKLLNNIMVAVNALTAKLDKIDLSKIESQLSAIIKNGNLTNTELANITKLLETLNAKADKMDKNEAERNEKILKAIADLKGGMVAEFEKLVKIGNENNKLTSKTNELINTVIELMKKQPTTQVDLTKVIQAIKETGSSLNASLINIANMLKAVNEKIDGLDKDCVTYFKAIIDAIGKKTSQGVDLTEIEKKLDAILQAIKDHKVIIKGGCGCCNDENFCNDPVNEGVIEDLNWLLG